jgi:enoyl-CoA hydratase/carnithine racemase
MSLESIILEKREGIAKITLNRPQALNALSEQIFSEITAALEDIGKDESVGVVIITGAGRAFSAGRDIKDLREHGTGERGGAGAETQVLARKTIEALENLPKPVIAMVNGYCLTGALELAMGCDVIIASENAVFGDTHARWGLRPTWGLSQRLPRAVGVMKAKELSFTADMISAQEAERIGLINKVVPAEKLEEATKELAEKMLSNSRGSIAAYKYLINQGMKTDLATGLRFEVEAVITIEDTQERLQSFGKGSRA